MDHASTARQIGGDQRLSSGILEPAILYSIRFSLNSINWHALRIQSQLAVPESLALDHPHRLSWRLYHRNSFILSSGPNNQIELPGRISIEDTAKAI